MDEQLKEKIFNILSEKPSENCCLDYKVKDEYIGNMGAFLKDLCSFLNSIEGYGKDKFIILGVSAKQKKILGLKNMQDDKEFQNFADKIEPRPKFETGTIKYSEKNEEFDIGYIYIPADNVDRVYSFKVDYPPIPRIPNSDTKLESKERVYASTALIRRGSCNKPLSEYDRREIYKFDTKNTMNFSDISSTYYDINISSTNEKILKAAIIFGGWDETNKDDIRIISEFVGKPYTEWISILRALLKEKNDILEYKNNKWKIKNKYNAIKKYAPNFFKDELELFKNLSINVLTERNPKFDLEYNERTMANIYNKKTKYSDLIRTSIAETIPIIRRNFQKFENCKTYASNLPLLIVREVLENNNWEIWASIDKLLPLLAESCPEEFLEQIDYKLRKDIKFMEKILTEKEYYITTYKYSTGIYLSLELIAWESRNLIESCMILNKIASFDNNAINHIANIILPWYPQTKAPIENRIIVVENILRENPNNGWELLKKLMPGNITTAVPSYKPKWNDIIEEQPKVTHSEYWEQIDSYIELAIKNSKTNTKKICDLIDIIDNLPEKLINKIIIKLSSNQIKKLSENRKFVIWNHLEDLLVKYKNVSKDKYNLSKEIIEKLESLSSDLKPKDIIIFAKRYFRNDVWNLIENRKDYKKSEQKIHEEQLKIIKQILMLGYEKLINFVKNVEDSYSVGIFVAELNKKQELEYKILECLNSNKKNLVEFSQGYAYKKFDLEGYNWIEKLKIKKWPKLKKLNILLILPCNKKTFDLVNIAMNNEELDYWKKTNIRSVTDTNELNYAMEKLLNVHRPDKALHLLVSMMYNNEDCNYSRELAIRALEEIVHKKNINLVDTYDIKKIINSLQVSDVDKQVLFNIEWSYLPILDGKECRPKTIEEIMADDPNVYNDILCLAYKPHSSKIKDTVKIDEKVATNAYILLNKWKWVPGTIDGKINPEKLNEWYGKMIETCKKSDRLEVALSNFGKVLFYSPKDNDGFWIDKNVANILNEENSDIIREGFCIEAFNSIGVITYDSEGSFYNQKAIEYSEKSEESDKRGFYRLAKSMRKLSDTFKIEAENTREHYSDF